MFEAEHLIKSYMNNYKSLLDMNQDALVLVMGPITRSRAMKFI